jgi:hypothetical protein
MTQAPETKGDGPVVSYKYNSTGIHSLSVNWQLGQKNLTCPDKFYLTVLINTARMGAKTGSAPFSPNH